MRLDAGMDTGDILLLETEPILETDTAQSLHDRFRNKGDDCLLQTLNLLRQGTLLPQPQDSSLASYAPPLKKEQGEIRWDLSAVEIDRWIRGLSPWPGAFTFLQGKRLIIHQAGPESGKSRGIPGTVHSFEERKTIQVRPARDILSLS